MKFCALSQFAAKNAPEGRYADGKGLWLYKRDRANGKWVLRYFLNGRRHEMGLGRWPDVSIAEAREKAAEARTLTRDQICPVEARNKSRRVVHRLTVKEAVEGCFEARKAQLKGDGEAGRWMSPMTVHVLPKMGKQPIEEVDQHGLKEMLQPIWHKKPEAASKALQRMSLTLKHAAALGLNVDLQATAKARALLGKQRHETEHIAAIPYAETPAFYQWLRSMDTVSARALRFMILTLGRTSEVRLASHEEIAGNLWTLPAERTKTNAERRVPLVGEAVKIVGEGTGYLFPAYRAQPLSDAAMATLMKRAGYDARPHGFRSTFRTWAEECTDADYETKEACLGHAVDAGVVGAYQRSDRLEKRRKLLGEWQAFLLSE